MAVATGTFGQAPAVKTPGGAALGDPDKPLLEQFDKAKRECFADRWRYERVWTRAIHYTNMRQWLGTYDRTAGWMDSRVARGVPKPVTSKPKEGVQAIRAMFTAAQLGVDVRPLKNDVKSMTTATTADKLAPVLYTSNEMDIVLHEGDYWFIVCGNVVYHVSYDDDGTFIQVPFELCLTCGYENTSDTIAKNAQKCPQCGKPGPFKRAVDPNGQPKVDVRANGHTVTTPLSPLEVAFPFMRARWSDVNRLIRMRWRTKAYYESHPELAPYVKRITFAKTSTERSLQIFQSLPFQTELSPALGSGYAGSGDEEGVAEYELWEKPTPARPDGFVMRVAGDSTPLVLHIEESEGLPGPLPYHEANGNPRWTFHHACYEHVGGRVLGTGALEPAMSKFDQLNRLDSIVEMMMTRMAIPQVIKPKGQEIHWLGDSPAMPGLIAEYAPAPGGGKPEQWPGQDPPRSWAQLRLQLSEEIDAALGTNDILRGRKPPNVEAFSAMQLLVEAGEARFAGAFKSRALAFRDVTRSQVEIEREFGPDQRVQSVVTPGRGYNFQTFQKADLDGEVTFDVADGSTKPKTQLAERASIEHLKQLGGINIEDPDTKYAVYQKLGQTDLIPATDNQHQCALQNQELFMGWIRLPAALSYVPQAAPVAGVAGGQPALPPPDPATDPTYPFILQPWYEVPIHRVELVKWAVSDEAIELFKQIPAARYFVGKYLGELDAKVAAAMTPPQDKPKISYSFGSEDMAADPAVRDAFLSAADIAPPASRTAPSPSGRAPQGAGRAMANSNQNSAPVGNQPQPAMPAVGAGAGA
jgi:hypothetical protein